MPEFVRTYRVVALLTASALMGSTFAPLSSLCGMEKADPDQMAAAMGGGPCPEMLGSASETASDEGLPAQESTEPMFNTSCCVVKALLAPKTERAASPVATSIEVVSEITFAVAQNARPASPADESPPHRRPVALHLLFGCFLT